MACAQFLNLGYIFGDTLNRIQALGHPIKCACKRSRLWATAFNLVRVTAVLVTQQRFASVMWHARLHFNTVINVKSVFVTHTDGDLVLPSEIQLQALHGYQLIIIPVRVVM